jgi:hypothetical protein
MQNEELMNLGGVRVSKTLTRGIHAEFVFTSSYLGPPKFVCVNKYNFNIPNILVTNTFDSKRLAWSITTYFVLYRKAMHAISD